MRAISFALLLVAIALITPAYAQRGPDAAFARLVQLTAMFHGDAPYACDAIVEVKYKDDGGRPLRDTSRLIYHDGKTYYRSGRVERVEGPEGELIVNHELRTVSLNLSDSIRQVLGKDNREMLDPEIETVLEKDGGAGADMARFKKFLTEQCNASWEPNNGMEEIVFTPKNPSGATLLSMRIQAKGGKVLHYEYSYRSIYATDYYGNSRFRVVKTTYRGFAYEGVPRISATPSDLLQWNGWTVTLKKYKNYKLAVL